MAGLSVINLLILLLFGVYSEATALMKHAKLIGIWMPVVGKRQMIVLVFRN